MKKNSNTLSYYLLKHEVLNNALQLELTRLVLIEIKKLDRYRRAKQHRENKLQNVDNNVSNIH